MSSLPPPTGRPVTMFPRPDPWAEQQRRDEQHREDRRRRRRRWWIPIVAVSVIAAVAVAAVVGVQRAGDRASTDPAVTTGSAPVTAAITVAPESTVPPDRLVEVDRVWLIDRGDGVFDWGVSVRTPADAATRSGVVIDVRLVDADDVVVDVASGEVNGIGPESTGSVTGRLADTADVPVRLEFDVAVGVESNDRALGDVLDVRALERTADSVRGRIRSESATPIDDIVMVLLWLDDDDEVIAAVPQPVGQVRPDVDARFDIDLETEVVPDGRPDAAVWTR